MLLLNVIDSSFLLICLILWFFAVLKKFKVFLNNQQERIGILQLKLSLNNKLVSNTLLTEIVKSDKYFPLTSYYQLSSKLAYICDAYKCKLFNSTRKNSLMNSIVL